jgi:hypothetical protein
MKPLPATSEHQTEMEQLRMMVASGLALGLLSFNSGLAMYLSRDDAQSVVCVGVSYLLLVLLFARRLGCGCGKEGTRRGGRWLKIAASCHVLLLVLLLSCKAARFSPPSTPVLVVAAAGAAALGLGGGCALFLHRRSW